MTKRIFITALLSHVITTVPAQATKHFRGKDSVRTDRTVRHLVIADTTSCFPLQKDNVYKIYDYIINVEDKRVIQYYKPIFSSNKFEFTGYVWEGIIQHILRDAPREISDNVILRAEHSRLMVRIINFKTRKTFPEYFCPIISNLWLFERYVRSADRTLINNY